MAQRLIQVPWEVQPQELAIVDQSHPILRGIVGLWVPWLSPKNLVGSSELLVASAWVTSPGGIGGRFAGEVSTEAALLTSNWSFATAFTTGTAATISCVVGRGPSTPNNTGFGFHGTHTNATYAGAIYCGSSYSVIGKPTGGALSNNTRYVIGAAVEGTNGAVYNNGLKTASAGSLSTVNTTGRLALSQTSALAEGWTTSPTYEYFAQWSRALTEAEFSELAAGPYDVFFAPRRIWVPLGAGGTVHNVTLTESFSSTDAASSALTAAASATESIGAAETLAAVMTAVASLTEAASAADAQTAARVQAAAATEAATATDAQAATLTAARAVTEAASASDLVAAVALAVAAVSEAISATDAQSTSPIVTATLTEAASAADSASVIATLAAALSESAAAADAITAAALLVRTLTESVNAADAATTAAQLVALLTESASLADVQSTGGGEAHNVSLTELATALDLVAAVLAAPDVPLDFPLFARTAAAQARRIGRGSLDATDRRIGSPSITKPAAG